VRQRRQLKKRKKQTAEIQHFKIKTVSRVKRARRRLRKNIRNATKINETERDEVKTEIRKATKINETERDEEKKDNAVTDALEHLGVVFGPRDYTYDGYLGSGRHSQTCPLSFIHRLLSCPFSYVQMNFPMPIASETTRTIPTV